MCKNANRGEKPLNDERQKRASEYYNEIEQQRQQIIDNAIKTGAVIPAERLFEPHQRYELVARQLAVVSDRVQAFSILDDIVQREIGVYHISVDKTKVFQNTTDTALLAFMVYTKIADILEKMPERGPMALFFLEQWKDQPTPTQTLPIPDELSTPEATELFKRAIGAGLMENASEGWKWLKTASLFGYFVDKVSDHLKIQSEGDRIPWKLFDYIVLKGKKTTARQAVNGYKNKSLNPPEGFREVDNLFK